MSDQTNPYQSPQAAADLVKPQLVSAAITEPMLAYLRGASPWLRFSGIAGFIVCGLLAALGLVSLAVLPRIATDTFLTGFAGSIMGAGYIVGGIVGFFPARYMDNFGNRIRNFLQTHTEYDLEQAFKNNKSFWKFTGVMTIVSLAVVPLGIVIFVIIGVSSYY